ncbi:MAG: YopX family protein [Oscillospiraceae bacterium]|nr:YopX family protein [Oscillospiraceae bacterium]
MRTILFRGKCDFGPDWKYGYLTAKKFEDGVLLYILTDYMAKYSIIPNTIGQYTGLDDKNGKPIYEGDIVKLKDNEDDTGVIKWADGEAMFMFKADTWCTDFDHIDCEDVEVIGNIHDNPELLEVEK